MNRSSDERRDGERKPPQQPQDGQEQRKAGSGAGETYGEGNYQATREYNRGLKEHMEKHDVEREARAAAPRSEEEARQMEEAERAGKSKARDAGDSGKGA